MSIPWTCFAMCFATLLLMPSCATKLCAGCLLEMAYFVVLLWTVMEVTVLWVDVVGGNVAYHSVHYTNHTGQSRAVCVQCWSQRA